MINLTFRLFMLLRGKRLVVSVKFLLDLIGMPRVGWGWGEGDK